MRRVVFATLGVALLAVVAATVGVAQRTATSAATRSEAALPKLPPDLRLRNRLIIGVRCDAPPFGYIDAKGKNQGFDVDLGRRLAGYAFGHEKRVSFVCAPTASRELLITSGRVDLVISKLTYTAERDTRIDF